MVIDSTTICRRDCKELFFFKEGFEKVIQWFQKWPQICVEHFFEEKEGLSSFWSIDKLENYVLYFGAFVGVKLFCSLEYFELLSKFINVTIKLVFNKFLMDSTKYDRWWVSFYYHLWWLRSMNSFFRRLVMKFGQIGRIVDDKSKIFVFQTNCFDIIRFENINAIHFWLTIGCMSIEITSCSYFKLN